MKIFLLLFFLAMAMASMSQHQKDSLVKGVRVDTLKYTVYFDTDKSNLRPEVKQNLVNWANVNLNSGIHSVQLYGHTDTDGKDEYNEVLSENRCQSVLEALKELGVRYGMFQLAHFGERQLFKPERSKDDKSSNRRVEVIALKNVEYEYMIPYRITYPCPETMIFLPQGTGFKMDTCVTKEELDCIKIEEFVTPEAARNGGMHTMDDEGMVLRSGGMIKFDICDDRTVQVYIPMRVNCSDSEMDLYEQTADGWKKMEEKPKVVEIGGKCYYSFAVNGKGAINCDVIMPDQYKLPKLILKAKKGLKLVEARLSCDNPFIIQAKGSKKGKGRKIEFNRNCCPDSQVKITAKLSSGEVVELPYGSLNRLDPRKSLIGCKTSDKKRVLFFKIRKKSMYRVYRVRVEHFK